MSTQSITWSKLTKANVKNIYIVAYHRNLNMYVSLCTYVNGKFVPIKSIGDVNGAILNQDPNTEIEDFLSISNLNNLVDNNAKI
jgi:hypothetical protein